MGGGGGGGGVVKEVVVWPVFCEGIFCPYFPSK